MRISVFRKAHFNAAHRLHNSNWSAEKNKAVFGLCNNPNYHGHNYDLEVCVSGEVDPETGYLIDLKVMGTEIDVEMVAHLQKNDIPFLPVATKMDKLNMKERNANIKKLTEKFGFDRPPLMISSTTGKGIDKLWSHLMEAIEK